MFQITLIDLDDTTPNIEINSNKKNASYYEFQKDYGTANTHPVKYKEATNGKYEWHHIVEENQIGNNNILAKDIYNLDNTISLGYDTHRKISSIYSTNIENLKNYELSEVIKIIGTPNSGTNQTLRKWLSSLSYEDQYIVGIEILRIVGVTL